MPFIGFPFPSHTHDVVPFLLKLVSKGLSETIAISELLEFNKFQVREQTETIAAGETLGLQVFKFRTLAETISISEVAAKSKPVFRSLTETVSIPDNFSFEPGDFEEGDFEINPFLSRIVYKARTVDETILSSEDLSRGARVVPKALSETVSVSEALARISTKARALSQ